ncbi:MAG: hypothetical protein AB7Q37_06200 [Pyrinomonadaceae bacterium]
MSTSVISEIEKSIFALPEKEQLRLIARVTQTLRKRQDAEMQARLAEMASDPDIQRELKEIEKEFRSTELDGLPG